MIGISSDNRETDTVIETSSNVENDTILGANSVEYSVAEDESLEQLYSPDTRTGSVGKKKTESAEKSTTAVQVEESNASTLAARESTTPLAEVISTTVPIEDESTIVDLAGDELEVFDYLKKILMSNID